MDVDSDMAAVGGPGIDRCAGAQFAVLVASRVV